VRLSTTPAVTNAGCLVIAANEAIRLHQASKLPLTNPMFRRDCINSMNCLGKLVINFQENYGDRFMFPRTILSLSYK